MTAIQIPLYLLFSPLDSTSSVLRSADVAAVRQHEHPGRAGAAAAGRVPAAEGPRRRGAPRRRLHGRPEPGQRPGTENQRVHQQRRVRLQDVQPTNAVHVQSAKHDTVMHATAQTTSHTYASTHVHTRARAHTYQIDQQFGTCCKNGPEATVGTKTHAHTHTHTHTPQTCGDLTLLPEFGRWSRTILSAQHWRETSPARMSAGTLVHGLKYGSTDLLLGQFQNSGFRVQVCSFRNSEPLIHIRHLDRTSLPLCI